MSIEIYRIFDLRPNQQLTDKIMPYIQETTYSGIRVVKYEEGEWEHDELMVAKPDPYMSVEELSRYNGIYWSQVMTQEEIDWMPYSNPPEIEEEI